MKKIPRRQFVLNSAKTAFFLPLMRWIPGKGLFAPELDLKDTNLRYVDDSGALCHFYLHNASVDAGNHSLTPVDSDQPAYLIAQISPQSLHEEFYLPEAGQMDYPERQMMATLSGPSYLAFKLWPNAKRSREKYTDLSTGTSALMDWDDPQMVSLVTTADINNFRDLDCTYRTDDVTILNSEIPKQYDHEFYVKLLKRFLPPSDKPTPLTIFEMPTGLYLAPHIVKGRKQGAFFKPNILDERTETFTNKNGLITTRRVFERWNTEMIFRSIPDDTGVTTQPFVEIPPVLRAIGLRAAALQNKQCEVHGKPNCDCDSSTLETLSDGGVNTPQRFIPSLLDRREIVFLNQLNKSPYNNEKFDIKTSGAFSLGALGATVKFLYKNYDTHDIDPNLSLVEYEHHFQDGRDIYIKVARIGVIAPTCHKALHIRIAKRKISNGVSFMEYKEYIEVIDPIKNFPVPKFDEAAKLNTSYQGIFGDNTTNYRMMSFAGADAAFIRTPPIRAVVKPSPAGGVSVPDPCKKNFWVYKEKVDKDSTNVDDLMQLPFFYRDRNDKKLEKASVHPIEFFRRDFFCGKEGRDAFFGTTGRRQDSELAILDDGRLRIPLHAQTVALTPDDQSADKDPNKINQLPTDYVEYYVDVAKGDDAKSNIFDLTDYPIFPQIRRAKVYIEHINDYTQSKLPSIIEYNVTYLQNGLDQQYNKGKLVFDHAKDFVEGKLKTLKDIEIDVGKNEADLVNGYNNILNSFTKAGERIGGLVNPDIQIQRIGLVRQALSLPADVNKQWETAGDRVLKTAEVLGGGNADLFCGLDLKKIMGSFLKIGNTPQFELNKVFNGITDINGLINQVGNHRIFKSITGDIEGASRRLEDAKSKFDGLTNSLESQLGDIRDQKDKLQKLLPDLNKLNDAGRMFIEKNRLSFIYEKDPGTKLNQYISREIAFYAKTNYGSIVTSVSNSIATTSTSIKTNLDKIIKENKSPNIVAAATKLNGVLPKLTSNYLTPFKDWVNDVVAKAGKTFNYAPFLNEKVSQYWNEGATKIEEMGYYQLVAEQIRLLAKVRKMVTKETIEAANKELAVCTTRIQTIETAIKNEGTAKFKQFTSDIQQNYKALYTELDSVVKGQMDAVCAQVELMQRSLSGYYFEKLSILQTQYADIFDKAKKGADYELKFQEKKLKDAVQSFQDAYDVYVDKIIGVVAVNAADLKSALSDVESKAKDVDAKINDTMQDVISAGNKASTDLVNDIKSKTSTYQTSLAKLEETRNAYLKELKLQGQTLVNQLESAFNDEVKKLPIKDVQEAYRQFDELKKRMLIPRTKELAYSWSQDDFQEADLGIIRFKPAGHTRLQVDVKSNISFDPSRYPAVVSKVDWTSVNTISDFEVTFFNALTVVFNSIAFSSGSSQPTSFDVKVRNVRFGGALSFIQKLEDLMHNLGAGFRWDRGDNSIIISYASPNLTISSPGFTFDNFSFGASLEVFFNRKPLEIAFNLASEESKATVAAAIYGGCFFFKTKMNSKRGIVEIDMAMEMGAYLGISLGIIKGYVKFMVGLHYRKNDNGVLLEGYFIAEGTLSVWILSVSARLYMYVRSENSSVEGGCTVTYSVKLGFLKKSFSGSYSKKLAGAEKAPAKEDSDHASTALSGMKNSFGFAVQSNSNLREVLVSNVTPSISSVGTKSSGHANNNEEAVTTYFGEDLQRVMNDEEWEDFYDTFYA